MDFIGTQHVDDVKAGSNPSILAELIKCLEKVQPHTLDLGALFNYEHRWEEHHDSVAMRERFIDAVIA